MTLGDGAAVSIDRRALALNFGKRRSTVFWSWWYGASLALTGATESGLALLFSQAPNRGFIMAALGMIISAAGWALTARMRFSSRLPGPATDAARLEQGIPLYPRLVLACIILTAALVVLLALVQARRSL